MQGEDGTVCRLYGNIAPFYIEDLSICGFWYLREGKFLNQFSTNTEEEYISPYLGSLTGV